MYDSIDNLPVYFFDKINKTGDVLLLKKGTSKSSLKKLEQVWSKIYNEFILKFGIADNFKQWLELQGQIVEHYRKAYCEGQRHEINFAKIKEFQCEKLMDNNEYDFDELVSSVSKFMQRRINTHEETVTEFYSAVKLMIKSGKVNPDNRKVKV